MKTIQLMSITLKNFKGIRDKSINFNSDVTRISGRNGIGKTTIFDAFTWVLFGKDSQDRKSFAIKTLDADGSVIPDIPHEATAVFVVDGEMITLKRIYREKWVKQHGSSTRAFTGHEEERYCNYVPCSVKEWDEKISAICDEEVFKFITSPSYFVSQKADVQREMLFDMAGRLSDADIAGGDAAMASMISGLGSKTIAEYKKELAATKRSVKQECDTIPARIDERKRDIAGVDESTFPHLDKQLAESQKELEKVEQMMTDESKRISEASTKEIENERHMADLKRKLLMAENAVEDKVTAEWRDKQTEQMSCNAEINRCNISLARNAERIAQLQGAVDQRLAKREKLIAEWRELQAMKLEISEDAFVCPTCGRPLEADGIEAKTREMSERFNKDKAERIAKNNAEGLENKKFIDDTAAMIQSYQSDSAKLETQKREQQEKLDGIIIGDKPDSTEAKQNDPECIRLRNEIEAADNTVFAIDDDAQMKVLKSKKEEIQKGIDMIKSGIKSRDDYRTNVKRVDELQQQLINVSQELADIEQQESLIAAFEKKKVEMVEKSINALFNHVTFRMYEQQINGGEKAICEAALDGKPYSTLSNAERINAGLDIISTICRYKDICAPIFIDNCESVNEPQSTEGQQIRLYVSLSNEMTIE